MRKAEHLVMMSTTTCVKAAQPVLPEPPAQQGAFARMKAAIPALFMPPLPPPGLPAGPAPPPGLPPPHLLPGARREEVEVKQEGEEEPRRRRGYRIRAGSGPGSQAWHPNGHKTKGGGRGGGKGGGKGGDGKGSGKGGRGRGCSDCKGNTW